VPTLKETLKKDVIAALDIGSSSVKIAQFIREKGALRLIKSGMEEYVHDSARPSTEEEIVSALKKVLHGVNIRRSKFIAVINCPKTALKRTVVPYMPRSEMRQAIRLGAREHFPFSIEDSLLDFEVLGDIVEKGIRKYEVAVSVSPKVTVAKYLALLKKVGIKPSSLISSSYALLKLAEYSYSHEGGEAKTLCFIDIGASHTELIITRGKTLMFSRKIPLSAGDFTKALTAELASQRGKMKLTPDEAEIAKRETGIPHDGDSRIIDGKISAMQMLSLLRTPLEHLANEIHRCFDYYREETDGGKIDSVVLFGGGAALGGLTAFLSDELGIEVRLGEPTKGIEAAKDIDPQRNKISYQLGPAIGAALGAAKGINLLPPEIKEETKRTFQRATIQAVATAVILISVLFYIGMRIKLSNLRTRVAVANLECSSLKHQLKKAEAHHLANKVLVNEPHWEDGFRELSNLIPESIHLSGMEFKDGKIIMRGIVTSEDGERVLSDFIISLEKGLFEKVTLVETKDLKDRTGNEFVLNCRVGR